MYVCMYKHGCMCVFTYVCIKMEHQKSRAHSFAGSLFCLEMYTMTTVRPPVFTECVLAYRTTFTCRTIESTAEHNNTPTKAGCHMQPRRILLTKEQC